MLTKHLKIFLLNFSRNRAYSVINILGLSTGVACSILILLWVTDELSFDRYHKNANQIYRIVGDDITIGKTAQTCGALAEYMKQNFTGVEYAARYMPYGGSPFKHEDKLFMIEKGAFTDPAFLQMFSFTFISGDPQNALNDLSNIVITESMSKMFFGNEKPVGKVLFLDGTSPMVISAVISDPPANSQMQFSYLLNTGILKYIGIPIEDWSSSLLYTFIHVQSNSDIQKLNSQISNLMGKHIPGFGRKLFLQPLTDIHLNTEFTSDFAELGDKKYVYIFSSIAMFLILIACINYINLSTARVLKRSKEIGLRKIMGSTRLQLIGNYLVESFLFVTVSFIIAIVLTEIFLPVFNQVSGKVISLNYSDISFWIKITVLVIIVSLLAGVYPALFLSSVKPIVAIKNILTEKPRGPLLRKTLVVIQFSLAIMLIVATTIVYNQLNFIKNKKLGFDKENIIYFKAKGKFQQDYSTMKNEMLSQSSIIEVTAEDQLLTSGLYRTNNVGWEGKDEKNDLHIDFAYIDYNYFNMLSVQMKDGRNFSKEMGNDRNAFILNEEAVNQMKIKQPVGSRFVLNKNEGNIIGVIKNTNFKSLHNKVPPTAYMVLDDYSNLSFVYNGIILIKAAAGKSHDAIAAIETIWKKVNPDISFEFHFLDETIVKQYVKENRTGEIFGYFSLIAIFISCLGLYGLTDFTIENRIKEIGVRKVLGASVVSITQLFYYNFLKLIIISNVISVPLVWYAMNEWLQNFAYKTGISWWMFVFAGLAAFVIAIATISFQAIKAALANPIDNLRYE